MTDLTPTAEQQAILTASTETSDNMIIQALAGAAKTSTLVMLANQRYFRKTAILSLAFNKKIADEMRERLPTTTESLTLNALGHRTWMRHLSQKLFLETDKTYKIVSALIEAEKDKDTQAKLYDRMSELLKLISFAKTCGFVPEEYPTSHIEMFESNDDFFSHLPELPTLREQLLIVEAMTITIDLAFDGHIDFDDQILMPTLFHASFPAYPLVLIDEAQDLSSLQHVMLKRLKAKRYIAVGDPCQAIYGFRGAHEESMGLMAKEFNMTMYTLSISFRCPKAVVRHAQWRAPNMRYPDWAEEGEVRFLNTWMPEHLPTHATILCRNNAPLFKCAINLLKEGLRPEIVGKDIMRGLLKTLRKVGKPDMLNADVRKRLDEMKEKRLSRARNMAKPAIRDEFLCLSIFCDHGDKLREISAYATYLMNQVGTIKLMTGHKSKGLEFPEVFILDRELLTLTEGNQDRNLLYVMQTRSLKNLTYITNEMFNGTAPATME